jgi:hypothetical protein
MKLTDEVADLKAKQEKYDEGGDQKQQKIDELKIEI